MNNLNELEFFSPHQKTDDELSSVFDLSLMDFFDFNQKRKEHPYAFFVYCESIAINPLKILNANQDQIKKVIKDPMYYEKQTDKWIPSNALYKQISQMKMEGWFVEWVYLLGNQKLIFCFNNNQQLKLF